MINCPYKFILIIISLIISSTATAASSEAHKGEQLFPLFTYRTGAYANVGVSIVAGQKDMLNYLNETEGGINGVRNYMVECETSYDIEKGIECFNRYVKGYEGAPTATIAIMNSGQFAGGQQRSYETKVPHMLPGVAISTAIFGRFNEYQFPVMLDYWREAQVVVEYIAKKLGGHDKLKNQVIVTMYHDSGYGRQTIEPMKILAEKYGFKDIQIPVAHPGVQQESQWRQVRYEKADWVFFRGWGAMTPVGIKTAQRSGFPVDHIIGDIWATSEDDVRPAGSAAIGYTGVNIFPPGKDYKLLKDIKVALYDKGKGDLDDMNRFGSVYYNFGLLTSLIYSEMIRTAHNEFGVRPITGEEARWAYENLDITQKRIEELGADGLMAPLKLTPCNHQGENLLAKVIQWNGKGWDSTDWIDIDRNLFVPVLLEKAEAAAKDKGIAPRDFQCNYTDKNA